MFPEYTADYKSKIVLPQLLDGIDVVVVVVGLFAVGETIYMATQPQEEGSITKVRGWTWMTRESVLFLHYTTIGGRQYATQTYTLDRRSGRFEVCDFTGGSDQPVACDARWQCVPATPPAAPGIVRSSDEGRP